MKLRLLILSLAAIGLVLSGCSGDTKPNDGDALPDSAYTEPTADTESPDNDEERPSANTESPDNEEERPSADPDIEQVSTSREQPDFSNVSMTTERESYPMGTERIKITITNNGTELLEMSTAFEIEFLADDNTWQKVKYDEVWESLTESTDTSDLYEIQPGRSHKVEIYLQPEYRYYSPGRHRVVNIDYVDGAYVTTGLAAEFDIE